jgi:hypothetical protein
LKVFFPLGIFLGTPGLASAADCNTNGVDDSSDISQGTSADCNSNGLPDECELTELQPGFDQVAQHDLHGTPVFSTVADFNRDGFPDVATADSTANGVSVLINQGDDSFAPASLFPSGEQPIGLTATDLNRDGHVDIAVIHAASPSVSVLLNHGAGNFSSPETFPLGSGTIPGFIANGDLDGDADGDLVTVNPGSGDLAILRNSGFASFEAPVFIPAGRDPRAVVVEDLDLDGDLDLAVALPQGGSGRVEVFINRSDGSFVPPASYSLGFVDPSHLIAVDLDLDGDKDLVVADRGGSGGLFIFTNSGAGTFRPYITPLIPGGVASVASGDLDGDRRPDLVAAVPSSGRLVALLNGREARFQERVTSDLSASPRFVTAADLNSDGRLELAVPSSGVFAGNRFWVLEFNLRARTDADMNGVLDECEREPLFRLSTAGTSSVFEAPNSKTTRELTTQLYSSASVPRDFGVQSWFIALTTRGCSPTSATTAGTVAADVNDRPPGLRNMGFEHTRLLEPFEFPLEEPVDGGVVSAAVLSFTGAITLDPAASPQRILRTTVALDVSVYGSCRDCLIRYDVPVHVHHEEVSALTYRGDTIYPASEAETLRICGGTPFHRGDPNSDAALDLSDGIFIINFLFLGGESPDCSSSADSNDDSRLDIADAIYLFNFLYNHGAALPPPGAPGEDCGFDPGGGQGIPGCALYTPCAG